METNRLAAKKKLQAKKQTNVNVGNQCGNKRQVDSQSDPASPSKKACRSGNPMKDLKHKKTIVNNNNSNNNNDNINVLSLFFFFFLDCDCAQ